MPIEEARGREGPPVAEALQAGPSADACRATCITCMRYVIPVQESAIIYLITCHLLQVGGGVAGWQLSAGACELNKLAHLHAG
jgi:hypothetical protein